MISMKRKLIISAQGHKFDILVIPEFTKLESKQAIILHTPVLGWVQTKSRPTLGNWATESTTGL